MDNVQETAGGFGEFALIERMRGKLRSSDNPDVVVGIGDDAAIIDAGGGKCWVISGWLSRKSPAAADPR